ncbi:hypothetical protein PRIPAC_82411 [Pristionchus pacificus]|uniref:Metalloendopeptidase n=1 Tax=Pristionchus pacificus TaxID=54126 RepID=A0A2A6C3W6_PRIPA|nr:hypothetical protein PRIPAC_82411 [Pristionchus pacificus]|eukprot:PDM72865.1 metallopeptidase [Pristionchus pacificus]
MFQPTMKSTLIFLSLIIGSALAAGIDLFKKIEKIEKEMSREVEEEYADKEHEDELDLLKKQFAAALTRNETFINIPTEIDLNGNHTGLFEGDIQLTPEQWRVALDSDPDNPMKRRQGLAEMTWMWPPSGAPVIPYSFANGFPDQYKQVVKDAIAFWEERTCIKFRASTSADKSAYVEHSPFRIKPCQKHAMRNEFSIVFNQNADGCNSVIGRRTTPQNVNLQMPGCMTTTIVAHELSHAFGTLHVQSRVDRDEYVIIDTSNIRPGMEQNFRMEPNGYSTYGLPYEFGSMQHYFPHSFAVDESRPTIYAKPKYQKFQPANAQVINVAATAQIVKVELPGEFRGFQEALVVLQAPAGKKIEAVVKSFGPFRFTMCRSVGLEIIATDTRTSGLRVCARPTADVIVYDGNTMLIWLYRDYPVVTEVSVRAI